MGPGRVVPRGVRGIVYRAHDTRLDKEVALKVVRREIASSPQVLERFRREARLAAKLEHSGIVSILAMGEARGRQHFTMALVRGHTLRQKIRAWTSRPELLAAMAEVCRTVQFAHDSGVIHRDLKPSNVMVDEAGRIKILDFGIAKEPQRKDEITLTATGQAIGTISYMAPEQADGDKGAVGPLSDVYSLGAMLYHCLTGRPPFEGKNDLQVLGKILTGTPVPPRHVDPSIEPEVDALVMQALARSPAERPSAQELADRLQRHLEGHARRGQDLETVTLPTPCVGPDETAAPLATRSPAPASHGWLWFIVVVTVLGSATAFIAGRALDRSRSETAVAAGGGVRWGLVEIRSIPRDFAVRAPEWGRVRWVARPGAPATINAALAALDGPGAVNVYSPASGTVARVFVEPGEMVRKGKTLVQVRSPGEQVLAVPFRSLDRQGGERAIVRALVQSSGVWKVARFDVRLRRLAGKGWVAVAAGDLRSGTRVAVGTVKELRALTPGTTVRLRERAG